MSPKQKATLAYESSLRKLMQKWGILEQKRQKKSEKIVDLSAKGLLKPSLLNKLTKWVENVADLHRKELEIINEIKDIEDKHNLFRKERLLRRAKPSAENQDEPFPPEGKRPESRSWLWILFLWMVSSEQSPSRRTPKND